MKKVSDLIRELKSFQKEYGDLVVYTAIDDEGNGYNKLYYSPTEMLKEIDEDSNRVELISSEDLEWLIEEDGVAKEDYISVCVL